MLAGGASNRAIAGQLVVTVDSVKKHVSRMLSKLGAANRTEAVARARDLGLSPGSGHVGWEVRPRPGVPACPDYGEGRGASARQNPFRSGYELRQGSLKG